MIRILLQSWVEGPGRLAQVTSGTVRVRPMVSSGIKKAVVNNDDDKTI